MREIPEYERSGPMFEHPSRPVDYVYPYQSPTTTGQSPANPYLYQQPVHMQPQGTTCSTVQNLPIHPQASTILLLGIAGCFVPLLSFWAWWVGNSARRDEHEGRYRASNEVQFGWVLGMTSSVLQVAMIFLIMITFGFMLYAYR